MFDLIGEGENLVAELSPGKVFASLYRYLGARRIMVRYILSGISGEVMGDEER